MFAVLASNQTAHRARYSFDESNPMLKGDKIKTIIWKEKKKSCPLRVWKGTPNEVTARPQVTFWLPSPGCQQKNFTWYVPQM